MSKNLMEIAQETVDIIGKGGYVINNKHIVLDVARDSRVNIYNPDFQYSLNFSDNSARIIINKNDTLAAAEKIVHDLGSCAVLNFASAKNPGGGFINGANAQEERIARASTLYCSIGSARAAEMYDFNTRNYNPFYSDYILYSPHVTVFRDINERLTDYTFEISVITAPAVNRSIRSEMLTDEAVDEKMIERTRKLLAAAHINGAENLVLGAWGCGVFRNRAEDVARYFHKVLIEENYGRLFKNIVFAIYEPSGRTDKYDAFCRVFENEI